MKIEFTKEELKMIGKIFSDLPAFPEANYRVYNKVCQALQRFKIFEDKQMELNDVRNKAADALKRIEELESQIKEMEKENK